MSRSVEPVNQQAQGFVMPPDPAQAGTLDDLVERLRLLKVWAGDPSFERITNRINKAWRAAGRPATEMARKTTVVDCFRPGRRRLNPDLVVAVVQALHLDVGYVAQWRQVLRVIGGETQAASQVRVQDILPQDLPEFTGRTSELGQLRQALHRTRPDGTAVVISAIEGMAGVGKTQLAIHAAHILLREKAFDRVLFVNLRGFHPDAAQPPADPAAVLDGFLRLLGVPGQQVPHDLDRRAAAYRDRLAGTQTLVVLDNAAGIEQVRPLLAATPGCLTLVTSRRSLTELDCAIRLNVDVFSSTESIAFLAGVVPEVLVGADPCAAQRIAERCGHLPLALRLIAGHIRGTPGWTLTDHADRLDERHGQRKLDTGVQLALDLSYQRLSTDLQRLLRLAALHPGQDFDAYAAAALDGTDLATAQAGLRHLCGDHLLQQTSPGRFALHDLVRAYAADRAGDQDPPPRRRAGMNRLLDYYLATSAAAIDLAYPQERQHRDPIPPPGSPTPEVADRKRAADWLDAEVSNLLAVAHHGAEHDRPEHLWQLSTVLDPHLRTRGRYHEAEALHQHALNLAVHRGNRPAEVNARKYLGHIHRMLGDLARAADHYGRALNLAQSIGDRTGELHALSGLGHVLATQGQNQLALEHHERALKIARNIGDPGGERIAHSGIAYLHMTMGSFEQAAEHYGQALQIAHDLGDRSGERVALQGLGTVRRMLGQHERAAHYYQRALQITQTTGHRVGELQALAGLGHVHKMLGRYEQATDHFGRALQIARTTGDRGGELQALASLGHLHAMLDRHSDATDCYRQVLDLAHRLGSRNWQFEAHQGLGRAHLAAGHPDLALTHHRQALQLATDLAQSADQARAHDGLAHAHHAKAQPNHARRHWQHALDILTSLGTDHTEDVQASVPNIRAHLRA